MIPVFIGCDIVREETSRDGAVHVIERKCKISVEVPYLLKKMIGADFVYFMQKNTLDRLNRTLSIEAYNLTFANRISIKENCLYYVRDSLSHDTRFQVNEKMPNFTCFEQSASLDAKALFGFESLVERIAVKHYAANIQKAGKEIIEYFIQQLAEEGTTYLPPFKAPALSEVSAES
ncbi:unnamed protein product [Soboliphyme baturini]|uniref:PRELI/MSF1 domain-containing protein n=1 Tax=Soboliphyme baturini TaxID=241478 RepID=A0A183IWZ4_9BILA|nr:unnamed protein product [Soboliphyme baturini]